VAYKKIYCLKAVRHGQFAAGDAGLFSRATTGDTGAADPVAPFVIATRDTEGDPCNCLVRARRCSDDEPIHVYADDTLVNFDSTYLFGFGTGAVCIYFVETDERYSGCGCFIPGAPGTFTELPDTDCPACIDSNPDPDFYLQAFDCDNDKPVLVDGQTVWALESDVTIGTVYWADARSGCITFKNPPSISYDLLLDSGDLTEQSNCSSCKASHAYYRAFKCSDNTATDIWVDKTAVSLFPAIYFARGVCVYFAAPAVNRPPVDPVPSGELTAYVDCVACLTAHPPGTCADCPSYEDAQAIYDTDLIVTVSGCGDTVVVTLSSNHNGTWGGSSGAYVLGLTCGGTDGKHWEMTVTILPDCTIVLRKCNDGETPLGDDYIVASGLNSDDPLCPCTDLDVTVDR
jgi:hypothetical protein